MSKGSCYSSRCTTLEDAYSTEYTTTELSAARHELTPPGVGYRVSVTSDTVLSASISGSLANAEAFDTGSLFRNFRVILRYVNTRLPGYYHNFATALVTLPYRSTLLGSDDYFVPFTLTGNAVVSYGVYEIDILVFPVNYSSETGTWIDNTTASFSVKAAGFLSVDIRRKAL